MKPQTVSYSESAIIPPQTVPPEAARPGRVVRYDPNAIAQQYNRQPVKVVGRFLSIFIPFALFYLNVRWDRFRGKTIANQWKRAIQLREILTKLGPAYIKVGQALSTRPDLVPPIYLEELAKLQDQLPPFPNEMAFRFIEEELGDRPENIYAELSPDPIAAASLGQVYKGKLKSGETVAVKVQRPDLQKRITLDLYLLRFLAERAQSLLTWIRSDLVAIMDEFAQRIFEEMDYLHEAHNALAFDRLYGHLKGIYVPKIYLEYTHTRVLTMEWVTGTKLTNIESLQRQGIDASELVEIGVQCSLRQLLEHGFFHADPHPGNLLATPDGKLAYLDFGMMSQIKEYQRYGLIEAVVHLVNRDFDALAQDYVELEFLTPDTDLTPIIPALAEVFGNALGASVAELNFKSITDQLSALMYEYPFRVPAYYALIIRSLVTLEGIAINADPEFKVLSKAYPYVAKRLLTDPSPRLRNSFRDLLFKEGTFRWNRLENLLRNARSSDDYDLDKVIDQAVDFLFSERGDFIRKRLVEEIVGAVDLLSRDAWDKTYGTVEKWFVGNGKGDKKVVVKEEVVVSDDRAETLDRAKRIWQLVQETPGFDTQRLLSLIPKLFAKPETQQMGQQIATQLVERAIARLLREWLLEEERDRLEKTPPTNGSRPQLPASSQRTKSAVRSGSFSEQRHSDRRSTIKY